MLNSGETKGVLHEKMLLCVKIIFICQR